MNTFIKSLFGLLVACAMIQPFSNAYGVDNMDPPWTRPAFNGDPNAPQTTFQDWTIDVAPDNFIIGAGVYAGGVPARAGGIFQIPNFIDDDLIKLLYIQITHIVGFPIGTHPQVAAIVVDDVPIGMLIERTDDVSAGVGLLYHTELWQIEPNPSFETIFIVGSVAAITHFVVDTISFTPVPEPATMAILGSSLALGALAKRRRARKLS